MTHICVGNLTIIGSDNGLPPGWRQAIISTNAGILLIWPLGTNFSEMLVEILTVSVTKMRLNGSSAKWRPFCLGLNVLRVQCMVYVVVPLSDGVSGARVQRNGGESFACYECCRGFESRISGWGLHDFQKSHQLARARRNESFNRSPWWQVPKIYKNLLFLSCLLAQGRADWQWSGNPELSAVAVGRQLERLNYFKFQKKMVTRMFVFLKEM